MFVKMFILSLSIILAVNTAAGQSDDEILRDLYQNCRKWANKAKDEYISSSDFWFYMGKDNADYKIITKYFADEKKLQQVLDSNRFSELFTQICKARGVPVKDWAASRKSFAAKKTIHDVALSQPEQTGASTSNTELQDDKKKILQQSFNDCRKWLGLSEDSNIEISGFGYYMCLKDIDKIVNDFFEKDTYASERMQEYYSRNSELAQGSIDLKIYGDLFECICNKTNDTVENLALQRALIAKTTTVKKVMSLPPDQRE